MADFKLTINLNSEIPIYVQVKNQIRLLIDRKILPAGTQLPTVRELALELGINANTVSRIYADLERENYLSRRRGIGTFAVDPHESKINETPGKQQLKESLKHLQALGYSDRQIIELTAEILEEFDQ